MKNEKNEKITASMPLHVTAISRESRFLFFNRRHKELLTAQFQFL